MVGGTDGQVWSDIGALESLERGAFELLEGVGEDGRYMDKCFLTGSAIISCYPEEGIRRRRERPRPAEHRFQRRDELRRQAALLRRPRSIRMTLKRLSKPIHSPRTRIDRGQQRLN